MEKKFIEFGTGRYKILMADDDKSTSRALSLILKKYGTVTVVESGNQAIELLKSHTFDLILTDAEMPQGTGLEVLSFLDKQNIKTPSIMITAFGTKELIVKTIQYHVFGFVEKPFSKETVENLVEKALTKKKEQDKMETLAVFGSNMGEMVHEISSPLTVLDAQISDMQEREKSPTLDKMSKSLEKIKSIIMDTKDSLRKPESLRLKKIYFSECLEIAQEEFSIKAKEKDVPITIEGDTQISILGDKIRISQLLVNLVNNAIDATSELPVKWIRIQIKMDSPYLFCSITDSGKGIPKEIKERLFESLFTTKGQKGNGLGLNIVKKIAIEHGGDIFIDPLCPNTQFVLKLPVHTENS